MRNQHRLCALHMRVRRHCSLASLFSAIKDCRNQYVKLFGNFVERRFDFVYTVDFKHAAAGGLGHLLEFILAIAVSLVGVHHVTAINGMWLIKNLQNIGDHVIPTSCFSTK